MTNNYKREYVVVIRAGSSLRLNPGENLRISVNNDWGGFVLTIQTRYADEGFKSKVPRELWIEARGQAPSLNDAVETFSNAALFFTTLISFCANGYSGDCQFHLAFDDTPKESEREYFTQFVEDERGLPRLARRIDIASTRAVIDALDKNKKHSERLRRAISQYVLALGYWKRGNEILTTAHLFMGMEALAKAVARARQEALQIDDEAFAQQLGIDTDSIPPYKLQTEILAAVRREILFQGDQECHRDAKKASDGIEHGYLSYAKILPLAENVRDKTSEYLRHAIIQLLELSPDIEQKLITSPYDKPFGTTSYIRFFRGKLVSERDKLAAGGQMYPLMDWSFTVEDFDRTSNGEFKITLSQSITPRIGEGVKLQPESTEIYGPEGGIANQPPYQGEIQPKIIKQDPNELQREEVFNLLDQIGDRVMDYGSDQFFEVKYAEALMLFMYSRCKSLFEAIKTLLQRRLPEEALILAGVLYVESLRLILLAREEDNRLAMVFGLADEFLSQKLGMFQSIFEAGLEENMDSIRERVEAQRDGLYREARGLSVDPFLSVEIEEKEMITLSSPECYTAYLLSKQMMIGSDVAYTHRKRSVESNRFWVETYTQNISILGIAAGFASESLLLASQASGLIFNWPELQDLQDLIRDAKALYNVTHESKDATSEQPNSQED